MVRFFATFSFAALLACGGAGDPSERDSPSPASSLSSSPTSWVTIEGVEFPAALAEAPDEVVEAYVFAAKHPEVLEHMPCYCGCEHPRFGHRSNYDCFVDAIDRSGPVPRVDPDPMGFG